MNRTQPNNVHPFIIGGIQTPLLNINQLVPGVFVTAVSAQYCWEVLAAPDGDSVLVRAHNRRPSASANHTCRFDRVGNYECRCGIRRQRVQPLLPVVEGPRCSVITPTGGETPVYADPYVVYGTAAGAVIDHVTLLPVVTRAVELWRPPQALIDLLAPAATINADGDNG